MCFDNYINKINEIYCNTEQLYKDFQKDTNASPDRLIVIFNKSLDLKFKNHKSLPHEPDNGQLIGLVVPTIYRQIPGNQASG